MADGGGAPAPARSGPPPRPMIALPSVSSYEALFGRSGGVGILDASPGPMTLVSSFFSEDPDPDCRSFSQLLAGSMTSPVASTSRPNESFQMERSDSAVGGGGGGGGMLRQSRPLSMLVAPSPSPFFMIPPGISPAGLLDSPAGMFSPVSGQFGMSHQQALAQVTAQAAQAHSQMHIQEEYPSSLVVEITGMNPQPTSSVSSMSLLQQTPLPTPNTDNTNLESAEDYHFDRKSQPTVLIVDKPADDGYNWRKYGQKQVKGSEYPRSYYKCTHPSCPVKKKVERSLDGHVTEIIYKGQHNHQKPASHRRGKEGATLPSGSNETNGDTDFHTNSETAAHGGPGNFGSGDMMVAPLISKRERESGYGTSEQLSSSSDGEEVGNAELGADEGVDKEIDPKRRNVGTRVADTNSHKTVTEAGIIVQTTSEVDLLDDGYRWRKYGQKVVKGNPHPRSYYKCTNLGCNVRKHVERASTDPKAVITTYEGKHNHGIPAARNSSHSTASIVANGIQPKAQHTLPNNQTFLQRTELRDSIPQPVSLQLKEEWKT